MKPEAQRIAIAEARGWVWYRIPKLPSDTREHRALFHPDILEYPDQSDIWKVRADGTERVCNMEYMEREGHVPQINLDEMHEAEMLLDDPKWTIPGTVIKGSLNLYDAYANQLSTQFGRSIRATAAQRAEAFLRTIGKWVEE